jgi:lipoprotein-anchoring transpeptidase ErfK/SrfK
MRTAAALWPRIWAGLALAVVTALFPLVLSAATPLFSAHTAQIAGQQTQPVVQAQAVTPIPRSHGHTSKTVVPYASKEPAGTIIISNEDRSLHVVLDAYTAARYTISVGRDGFLWTGTSYVGRKAEWPEWRPTTAMRTRDPSLPTYVPPGPYNPLGARAIYLYQNGADTLFRIHGTNTSETIGGYETSGCFRLSNADVIELYASVKVGTKVIVR